MKFAMSLEAELTLVITLSPATFSGHDEDIVRIKGEGRWQCYYDVHHARIDQASVDV